MNALQHFQPVPQRPSPPGDWQTGREGGGPSATPGGGLSSLPVARMDAALRARLADLCGELRSASLEPDVARVQRVVDQLIALAGVDEPAGPQPLLRLDGRRRVLLEALVKRAGDVCSLGFLAEAIGVRARSTKVVKVYVCQVRAELARHGLPDAIENVWGMGYLIAASDARRVRRLMRAKASDIRTVFNRESGNE